MLLERVDLWKAPYKRLLTTNTTAKLQGVEPWLCISQLKRAPPDIWSCANAGDHESNQPGREVADIMVGCSLPRGLKTFLSTPPSLSDTPFPNCYPRKASLGLPSMNLPPSWKENAIVITQQGLTHIWRSCSSLNHKLCPNARATVSLGQTQPSLYHIKTLGLFLHLWLATPKPREYCI